MTGAELDAELVRLRVLEREWIEESVRDGLLPPSALTRYEQPKDIDHERER